MRLAREGRGVSGRSGLLAGMGLLGLVAVGMASAAPAAPAMKLPPAVQRTVSFTQDVKPILAHNCFSCHARDKRSGALSFDRREFVLKDGE